MEVLVVLSRKKNSGSIPRNACVACETALRVWQTDRQTDRRTDDGQSDPYVSLCFAGDTIKRSIVLYVAYTKIKFIFKVMAPWRRLVVHTKYECSATITSEYFAQVKVYQMLPWTLSKVTSRSWQVSIKVTVKVTRLLTLVSLKGLHYLSMHANYEVFISNGS